MVLDYELVKEASGEITSNYKDKVEDIGLFWCGANTCRDREAFESRGGVLSEDGLFLKIMTQCEDSYLLSHELKMCKLFSLDYVTMTGEYEYGGERIPVFYANLGLVEFAFE